MFFIFYAMLKPKKNAKESSMALFSRVIGNLVVQIKCSLSQKKVSRYWFKKSKRTFFINFWAKFEKSGA